MNRMPGKDGTDWNERRMERGKDCPWNEVLIKCDQSFCLCLYWKVNMECGDRIMFSFVMKMTTLVCSMQATSCHLKQINFHLYSGELAFTMFQIYKEI